MFSQIAVMAFSLTAGIYSAYWGLSPAIIPLLLFWACISRRKLFNIALVCAFSGGFILIAAYTHTGAEEGICSKVVYISKTMNSGYIARDPNQYFMRCGYDVFEGDRIYGLFRIEQFREGGTFDDYLRRMHVSGYLIPVRIDSVCSGSGIAAIRVEMINRIRRNIDNDNAASLSNAIITGYRNDMSSVMRDAFNRTGTAHLLAISGLHTGIIFIIINILLFAVPMRKELKIITALIILIFFACLTYGNTPVVRAVIFIAIYSLSMLMHKKVKHNAMLFLAGIIIMVINPYSVLSLSFWLSFSAVYIILSMYRKTGNIILTLLLLPLLMTPLTLSTFGQLHMLSSSVSLLLIPLFFIYIPLSITAVLWHSTIINACIESVFKLIELAVNGADAVPLLINLHLDKGAACLLGGILLLMMSGRYRLMSAGAAGLLIYVLL